MDISTLFFTTVSPFFFTPLFVLVPFISGPVWASGGMVRLRPNNGLSSYTDTTQTMASEGCLSARQECCARRSCTTEHRHKRWADRPINADAREISRRKLTVRRVTNISPEYVFGAPRAACDARRWTEDGGMPIDMIRPPITIIEQRTREISSRSHLLLRCLACFVIVS